MHEKIGTCTLPTMPRQLQLMMGFCAFNVKLFNILVLTEVRFEATDM